LATRNPFPSRIDFGLSGPAPRDLLAILAVLFVTFSLWFFESTQAIPAALILSPEVWRTAQVWRLATYPFVAVGGGGIWFLLELLILYMFGKDVYFGLYRRHFWRLIAFSALGAGLVAVGVHALLSLTGMMSIPQPFVLMMAPRFLVVIFIAAFATAHADATILLFFILPIRARWFLWIELLFAFVGFLGSHDLPGFLGICTAVGISFLYIRSSGSIRKGGRRTLREMRLRLERWWIQKKLERNRRKRGFRVIDGDKDRNVRKGPWVN
jgi:Der1-like family protein